MGEGRALAAVESHGLIFGVPVLGNANYLLMYPPAWIRFIVPPDLAFHLFFVGHLLLGAWAFYGLCRRVRVTPTGAAWAALWYAASGAVLSLHCVLNLVPYVFLAPWAMARLEAVLRRGSRADTAWLAVAWALVATVAEPLMVGGLVALTLGRLAVWALTRRRSRGFGTGWRCLAGAVGLAVLMSGPALLEGARLLAHSDRGGAGSSDPRVYAQHPLLAVELWLPEALGFRFDGTGAYRGRELGVVGNPYLVSIFIGFGTLPLLGAAVARGRRKSTVGMLAGAAVFLIAAAGGYLPTLSAMHAHLPVLAWGRYPQKFVLFAAGLLLIVAARGLDRIRRAGGRSAGRLSDLAWMLAPVAALVAAGLLIPGVSLRGLIPLAVPAIFVACLARTGFAGASHGRQWAQAAEPPSCWNWGGPAWARCRWRRPGYSRSPPRCSNGSPAGLMIGQTVGWAWNPIRRTSNARVRMLRGSCCSSRTAGTRISASPRESTTLST